MGKHFEHVARHTFLPDTVYRLDRSVPAGTPDLVPPRRSEDPGGWLVKAYADSAVITQVDDGHPDGHGRGREASSSASAPAMVEALDAEATGHDTEPPTRSQAPSGVAAATEKPSAAERPAATRS